MLAAYPDARQPCRYSKVLDVVEQGTALNAGSKKTCISENLPQLAFFAAHRAMHSSANLYHSPRSSEAKLVRIEFSYLRVSQKDSIKPRCDQLDS